MKLNTKISLPLILILLSLSLTPLYGQQKTDYFDFWEDGNWQSEITVFNNDTIPEKDGFNVQKLAGKNAFLEDWQIYIGDGEYVNATVMRAYDQETNRWKLFYVDDLNAQTWDSEMIQNKLYFFKAFTYNGKKFYSRQAWSLEANNKVIRTIERSEDNENWTIRYWQIFKRVN